MAEGLQTTRLLRVTIFYFVVLVFWEVLIRLLHVPDWLLPAPSQILDVIGDKNSVVLSHTLVTLEETLLGFLLALVVGVIFAIGIVHFALLRDTLYPSLIMFNSFPKVAIAPLFVVWIGVGIESKIANAFLTALFPIVLNTIMGLTDMDPELLELVRSMSKSRWVLFWKIRLPHSLPYLFAGCKIAIPLAVIGAIVGEFISGRSGLGYLVLSANNYFNTPLAFTALLYLVLMSLALYGMVILAEKLIVPWYRREISG
ncbi:MAG TPA: ABC transporter permease [Candidatus Binatia bacterium]|nr:ABC transporter permease [Candidatus Binatia bacterium]